MKKWTQSNRKLVPIIISALLGGFSCYAQNTWRVPGDFPNIQSALDSTQIVQGDTVQVGPGEFAGAVINKSITLLAQGTNTVINSAATNSATTGVGFLFPGNGLGSGTTIQGFTFTNLSLPILSLGANDVVIYQNKLHAPEQGITSLGGTNQTPVGGLGNRWIIAQNEIFQPMSYGILFEEMVGNELAGNIVIRNTITGTNGLAGATNATVTGVAFLGESPSTNVSAFRNNSIVYNTVALTNIASPLPTIGILLWQQNTNTTVITNSISGNMIARNELSTGLPIQLIPAELEQANQIVQILILPGTLNGSTPTVTPLPAPGSTPGADPQREIEVVEGTISGTEPPADPRPAPQPSPGQDPDRAP